MPSLKPPYHVAVIVLGDVGRSPRMQYHALSLIENNFRVSLIGYEGEDLIPVLQDIGSDKLKIIRFTPPSPPLSLRMKLKPFYLLLRLFGLLFKLVQILWFTLETDIDCLLVQNPPSIPLLILSYLYTRTNARNNPGLVIDWHNLGFSMFDISAIRSIAKLYEKIVSPLADGNLCVTRAMKEYLEKEFLLDNVTVLYDRPPDFFKKMDISQKHDFFKKIDGEFENCFPELRNGEDDTLFTKKSEIGSIDYKSDRPLLIVSSTSWTPDEDFSILLNALIKIEAEAIKWNEKNPLSNFPKIVVMITGKGPQKKMYEEIILSTNLTQISILTMWLQAEDYPRLIGCADLGVSLHTSTSGVDLPMKIYDMFGCQVPVCAIHFECLNELVKDGVNGNIFHNENELAEQIINIAKDERKELEKLREGVKGLGRWRDNWDESAKRVILNVCSKKRKSNFGFMILVCVNIVLVLGLSYALQWAYNG